MMIVATEGAPAALRGRLALWLVEARAGLYVGNYGARVREMIWATVMTGIKDGNAVMAWASRRESGYEMLMCGLNRRTVVDLDGLLAVANAVDEGKGQASRGGASDTNLENSDEIS